MTYQGNPNEPDPNRDHVRRPTDYIRRDGGPLSPVTLLLAAILLVLVGWFILTDRSTDPTASTQTSGGPTNSDGSTKAPGQ
jgi:hypothetical protein